MLVLNHLVWGILFSSNTELQQESVGEGGWAVIGLSVSVSVRVILAAVTYKPHMSVVEHSRSLLLTHIIVQCSVLGWWTAFH